MNASTLAAFARAIAVQEGYFVLGSRPNRNRNPGDLKYWLRPLDPEGFAVFPSDEAGWHALSEDLANHAARYPTQAILDFIGGCSGWPGYAPASDNNDPVAYAGAIAKALGVAPDTKLEDLA